MRRIPVIRMNPTMKHRRKSKNQVVALDIDRRKVSDRDQNLVKGVQAEKIRIRGSIVKERTHRPILNQHLHNLEVVTEVEVELRGQDHVQEMLTVIQDVDNILEIVKEETAQVLGIGDVVIVQVQEIVNGGNVNENANVSANVSELNGNENANVSVNANVKGVIVKGVSKSVRNEKEEIENARKENGVIEKDVNVNAKKNPLGDVKLKNKSEDVSEKQQRIPTQVPKTKNHRRVVDDEILVTQTALRIGRRKNLPAVVKAEKRLSDVWFVEPRHLHHVGFLPKNDVIQVILILQNKKPLLRKRTKKEHARIPVTKILPRLRNEIKRPKNGKGRFRQKPVAVRLKKTATTKVRLNAKKGKRPRKTKRPKKAKKSKKSKKSKKRKDSSSEAEEDLETTLRKRALQSMKNKNKSRDESDEDSEDSSD